MAAGRGTLAPLGGRVLVLVGLACAPEPGHDPPAPSSTSAGSSSSETAAEPAGWFRAGFGETGFEPLEPGGPLRIVWGSQGLAMFPMPLEAGGFTLPDDPADFLDPKTPILELTLDVEGFNDGPGGHFKRIANYPVPFEVLDDGTYRFSHVQVIVPDTVRDPTVLEGKAAELWVQLTPYDAAPLVETYDLVVTVDSP